MKDNILTPPLGRYAARAGGLVLSIDQGTSSTKTLIFDAMGNVVAHASEPLKTHYFGEGFAEQDI